jgi:hypothetical protein
MDIEVTGAHVEPNSVDLESHCNGLYVIQEHLVNDKHCYRRTISDKVVKGSIFWSARKNTWMIWRRGTCSAGENGWNFSQIPDDLTSPYPPIGNWLKEKGNAADSPNKIDYSKILLTEVFFFILLPLLL